MNSISFNIKLLREEKNLSRKKLAELAGVSQPTIYNIENGKTDNITLTVGKNIAKALDTTFGELFEIEGAGKTSVELMEMMTELKQKIVDLQSTIAEKNQMIKLLQKENKRLFRERYEFELEKEFYQFSETELELEKEKEEKEKQQLNARQKVNIEVIQNIIQQIFESELFTKFEVLEMIYENDIHIVIIQESNYPTDQNKVLTDHLKKFIKITEEEFDIFLEKYEAKFSRSG
jgi:transcriptional regulator with XRE-family HTH domain